MSSSLDSPDGTSNSFGEYSDFVGDLEVDGGGT